MSDPTSPAEPPRGPLPGEQQSAEDLARAARASQAPGGQPVGWGEPAPGTGWTRRTDGSWDPPADASLTQAHEEGVGAGQAADATAVMPPAQDDTVSMPTQVHDHAYQAGSPPDPGYAQQDARHYQQGPGYTQASSFAQPSPPPPAVAPTRRSRVRGVLGLGRTHRRLKLTVALAAIFALGAFLGVAISNSFWTSHDSTATKFQPGNSNSGTLPFGNGGSGSSGSGSSGSVSSGSGTGTVPNGYGQTPYGDGSSGSSGSSGSGSQSGPSDVSSIASKVDPALVDINVDNNYAGSEGAATGIVLTSDGLVLTNNHVVDGATSITATDIGNGKTYKATVVGYDNTHDIALIKLTGASGLATAKIGDSSKVSTGDGVVAIGNAGGVGGTPSAVGGTVTGLNQQVVAADPTTGESEQLSGMLETNADIQSGDSGGPVVNTSGEVIGVTSVGSSGYSSFDSSTGGYAVPINTAMDIVDQIKSGDSSGSVHVGTTGFLGVSLSSGQSGSSQLGGSGSTTAGATVADVVSGSPAEKLGLTAGDVITAVDGTSVSTAKQLSTLIGSHKAGDTVTITWTDQSGSQHSGSVQLAQGPAD